MSQTTPLVPALVDDSSEEDDVEVELSGDGVPVESATELPDSTGTVVISGWVMPPKLDAPPPSLQADRLLVRARARRLRTGSQH